MLALATFLALHAAPAVVEQAVARSVEGEQTRAVVSEYRAAPGCAPEQVEAPRAIKSSGMVAVRVRGAGCRAVAWVRVRVEAQVMIAARPLRAGDPLEGATRSEWREVPAGRAVVRQADPGTRAAMAIPAGAMLEPSQLRGAGPTPGDALTVVAKSGEVEIELPGHAVPCSDGHACAVLASGRRVEGTWRSDKLWVEMP